MNNDQRPNDLLEESKGDEDVKLAIPPQRGTGENDSAPQDPKASENEFLEEEGSHKTRENADEGEDENDQDQNYHFYKEYCRLYYANIILTNRLQ